MKPADKTIMLYAFLTAMLLAPLSGAAWTQLPYYHNGYNITVANWSYTQNGTGGHAPAGFVLVSLSNVTSVSTIATRGYGTSLQPLGYVPFWLVSSTGNSVVLLLSNLTNKSVGWNMATVYYNSSAGLVGVTCPPSYPSTTTSTTTSSPSYYVTSFAFGRQCSGWSQTYPIPGSGNGYPQTFTMFGPVASSLINFTPVGATSNTASLQFVLNKCGYSVLISGCSPFGELPANVSATASISLPTGAGFTSSFVVLADQSMASRQFNASWWPNSGALFIVVANGTNYNLITSGCAFAGFLFCSSPFVSNQPVWSGNANTVFQGKISGGGYEGWFSVVANQIASEGMTTTDGATFINNAIKAQGVRSVLFGPSLLFNMTVGTSQPTSYYILPAFATDYAANQIAPNAQQIPTTACPQANLTNFYCYSAKLQVTNIHWVYNFSSNATGNALITKPVWFNYSSGKVPYAILNITTPYYNSGWGVGCSDIYIRAYSNVSGVYNPLGSVPYYILPGSCNGGSSTSPTARILIANITNQSNTFNNIDIYYGSRSGQGASPSVFSSWQIINSSNPISLVLTAPAMVFLQHSLNRYSQITVSSSSDSYGWSSCYFQCYEISTNSISTNLNFYSVEGPQSGIVYDESGHPLTSLVIDPTSDLDLDPLWMASRNLVAVHDSNYYWVINSVSLSVGPYLSVGGQIDKLYIDTNSIGTATVDYLWSNISCGVKGVGCSTMVSTAPTLNCELSNSCPFSGPPISVPATSNGINSSSYNSVGVTFNFNGISNNQVAIGDTGIQVPLVALYGIEIILLLVAFAAYEEEYTMSSIAIVAVMWIIGFFNYQLLAIAIMGLLMIIVEHYILEQHRHKGRGPPEQRGGGTGYSASRNPKVRTISGGSL